MLVIKKCANPFCDALYHNIPKEIKKCENCGNTMIEINKKTYEKKYINWYFNYDYLTKEYYHPKKKIEQLELF
jgi:hypothetical protein